MKVNCKVDGTKDENPPFFQKQKTIDEIEVEYQEME
jgi:hypothetical protein